MFHINEQGNHITEVTDGSADHVAIYLGGDSVLEAVPAAGVVLTPLSTLLSREKGYYVAGRVRNTDVEASLGNAMQYAGLPYDSLYLQGNSAIYCSELVELSFVDKNGGKLFSTIPMSFHNTEGKITEYWTKLYSSHGMTVPEGAPGTNPNDMMRSSCVIIKKLK